MKRILLISFLCFATFCITHAENTDEHLKQLAQCINDSDFVCAADQLPLVENWKSEKLLLHDIGFAISFYWEIYNNGGKTTQLVWLLSFYQIQFDLFYTNLYKQQQFNQAIKTETDVASFYLKLYGEDHLDYAKVLCNLGTLYQKIGSYSQAEEKFLKVLKIHKTLLGELHPSYASSLHNLGTLYIDIGNYPKAETYYLQALEIKKSVWGDNHPSYVTSLNALGSLYSTIGEYKKAENWYLRAMEIQDNLTCKQDNEYAITYNNLGNLYYKIGNYQKADTFFSQALEIRKKVLGETHPQYATSLHNMGALFYNVGEYSKAEVYFLQALEIRKSMLGTRHPSYATSLHNMGALYYKMGDYAKAEAYYSEALEIRKSILGENHPDYASTLNNLGLLHSRMGKYAETEAYNLHALEIKKSILGESHPSYATSLHNLGTIYYKKGDYGKAETYYLQALKIRKSVLGETHPDYATSLHTLGTLYYKTGDYAEAEKYYIQDLVLTKSILGEQHPNYASLLLSIGWLYQRMGDYDKAEKYYLQNMVLTKSISGEKHPDYASSLLAIGGIYQKMGNYSEAEKYYLQNIELAKSISGEKHPDYASSLNNIASLYIDMKSYAKAESYYLHALRIKKSVLGEQHPDYASSLNNLGSLYVTMKDYEKAEQYYLQALEIQQSVLGNNHPNLATFLNNIGNLYSRKKDYAKAESYYTQAQRISKNRFIQSLDFMSDSQRSLLWSTLKNDYEYSYPKFIYRYAQKQPSISTFAYENELFTKGLLLNSANVVTQSILESKDSTLIQHWEYLVSIKRQIIALEEKNASTNELMILQDEAETMEKEITRSSAAFRENMRQWAITWDSVRAALKPNQVAIEYMRAPLNENNTMYCALLLRDTCSFPIFIPLFEEKKVIQLLDISQPSFIDKAYSYYENGKELSSLVWGKLLPYINPHEIVFFAPTGLLHEVALESIPYDSTQVISDVYNLVRLSSTRELALHKTTIPHKSATLYGGIHYDVSADELLAQSASYPSLASRSVIHDTINRGRVNYLPGTKSEIEGIQKALSDKQIRVQTFTSTAANEESFKTLSGMKQNILHLATHGFYWADSTDIDPMERGGLLFAGANTALSGHRERLPEGVQDGILTAKEISVLDLREADIVVMSACETAQGEITGEGVFGLQRAFKMAGAQSLLMAIWPVDDDATQLLMTSFYRNLCQGMSKREAFRSAQQEVRNYTTDGTSSEERSISGKEKKLNKGKMGGGNQPSEGSKQPSEGSQQKAEVSKPYASPYYWAGFILLD